MFTEKKKNFTATGIKKGDVILECAGASMNLKITGSELNYEHLLHHVPALKLAMDFI